MLPLIILTIYPVDNEAFDDGNHKNTESCAVIIHQLKNIHAALQQKPISASYQLMTFMYITALF